MAENPLLPNDQLRALLRLTKDCARLDRAANMASSRSGTQRVRTRLWPSREALVAGTCLHLQPGDALLPEPGDAVSPGLAPRTEGDQSPYTALPAYLTSGLGGKVPSLLLGTAMAAAFRAAGTDRVVLVHGTIDAAEAHWAGSLRWAQEALLPLIFVCGDSRGSKAFLSRSRDGQKGSAWDAAQRAAEASKLPMLSVDGEDAVAVYRVTQESMLRARSGAGPAVLWAMLPSARDAAENHRPAAAKPVARLQRYLRARGIKAQAS